jgi:cell division protein FtsN
MERIISLPFTFVPKDILEYDLSAGIVEDSLRSRLLRTNVNYGVSRNVTIGAGYEHLTSVISSPQMPFLKGSFRLASNLILSGELTYKVRAKSTLIYRLPSNIQFDLNYTKYNIEQEAIHHNYLQELNASILIPISLKNFFVYNRLTFNQIVLPTTNHTSAEWLLSGSYFGVNTNLTTSGLFIGDSTPFVYSKLSLSYRFAFGLRITPDVQYGYTDKKLRSLKIGLEQKLIKHAYLNLSFEQDFKRNIPTAELGFRYNFNFAQTGISGVRSNNKTTLVQYARGSIISDRETNYFKADNIPNVGMGGITIIPFFDKNSNGRRDPGEVKVLGLNLHSSAGQIERIEKDTTIRILSLEAYTKCIIEFDDSDFDSPPLKLLNRTYSVHVDPNMLKEIEVPLIIAGKGAGTIRVNWDGEIRGLDGIVSHLYNKDQKRVGRIFSKADGSYKYDGLSLGSYVVRIDSIQLQRIGMTCTPDSIKFEITSDSGGTTVHGLDFMLELTPEPLEELPQKDEPDSVQNLIPDPLVQITRKDSTYIKIHELVQEVLTDTIDSYAIQLGAFGRKANATGFKDKLAAQLGRDVEIVLENGLYKVRILDFESREEVDEFIPVLSKNGVEELWVINLKGMHTQMTLMTIKDTITEVIEIRTEMPNPDDHSNLNLQLGAFRDSTRAEALRLKLSNSVDQPVIIEKENGYFKVRLAGFTLPEQRDAILPQLFELGFNDVWVLPYDTSLYEAVIRAPWEVPLITEIDSTRVIEDEKIEEKIAEEELPAEVVVEEVVEEEITEEELPEEVVVEEKIAKEELPAEVVVEEVIEEEITEEVLPEEIVVEEEITEEELPAEVVVEEEITEEVLPEEIVIEEMPEEDIEEKPLIEEAKVEKPIIEQPRFSIQAGIFPDLSEAKRAQRRIMSKLGLQSNLVQEFDYTRVLIPGFYTRQETYKYYPELAGLGYSDVQVIEKRK